MTAMGEPLTVSLPSLRQVFWWGTGLLLARVVLSFIDPRGGEWATLLPLLHAETSILPAHWAWFYHEPMATLVDMVMVASKPLVWPLSTIIHLWEGVTGSRVVGLLNSPVDALLVKWHAPAALFRLFPGVVDGIAIITTLIWQLLGAIVPVCVGWGQRTYWYWWTEWQYYLQRQVTAENELAEKQRDLLAMRQNLSAVQETAQTLQQQNVTDHLTQLYNKRFFQQKLAAVVKQAFIVPNGLEHTTGLMMMDIDHFKKLNDTYGHAFGDTVLADVAGVIRQHVPKGGYACRYGGEEFALIITQQSQAQLLEVAQNIRAGVMALQWNGTEGLSVSVSQGVMMVGQLASGSAETTEREKALLAGADAALYRAKQSGRNCCKVHQQADKAL